MRLLEEDPIDTYRAFNFFVTAEHLADWLHPGRANDAARKSLRSSTPLLQLCSHLANGMKHFRAEAKHHTTVSGATKIEGVYENVHGDVYGNVFGREITIQLDGEARQLYGNEISVVVLAKDLLQYWEEQVSVNQGKDQPRE